MLLKGVLPLFLLTMSSFATLAPATAQDTNEPKMLAAGDLVAPDAPGVHVLTFLIEFAPGAKVPTHSHGGAGQVLMISGSLDLTRADGTTTTYNAGDTIDEPKDDVHSGVISGTGPATMVWTLVLPDGAEMETLH